MPDLSFSKSAILIGARGRALVRLRRLPLNVECASSQAEIALRKAILRASFRFVGGLQWGLSRRATLSPVGVSRQEAREQRSRNPPLMSRAMDSPAAARRLARTRRSWKSVIKLPNLKQPG